MHQRIAKYLIIFFLVGTQSFAQPGDPGGGGDPDEVPIHGAFYLLLAGAALGFRKLKKAISKD